MMQKWRHNLAPKILSLIAAVVLWAFVINDQNPVIEVTYTVPVEQINLSNQYIVNNTPTTIEVVLRGPRNSIIKLRSESLQATLDLGHIEVGTQEVPIHFTPPTGMTIVSQNPATVSVTADRYAVKEIAVSARQLGTIPIDYGIKDTKIVPSTVAISGAKKLVDKVSKAVIDVKMDDRKKDFTTNGNIVLLDSSGNIVDGLTVTPYQGSAVITMEQVRFEKVVPIQGVTTGSVAPGYRIRQISITPKQVVVSGKQVDVDGITVVQTQGINVAGATKDISEEIPLGPTDNIQYATNTVAVTVEVERIPGGINGTSETGGAESAKGN